MASIELEIYSLAERLHRRFLDLVDLQLDELGVRDLNAVRALILMNLNEAEMTVSELMYRGCYLGSNVSYNLKKLTEAGYVEQVRSVHDRRVVMVRNTPKAVALCKDLFAGTCSGAALSSEGVERSEELSQCRRTLRELEKTCSRAIERREVRAPLRLVA